MLWVKKHLRVFLYIVQASREARRDTRPVRSLWRLAEYWQRCSCIQATQAFRCLDAWDPRVLTTQAFIYFPANREQFHGVSILDGVERNLLQKIILLHFYSEYFSIAWPNVSRKWIEYTFYKVIIARYLYIFVANCRILFYLLFYAFYINVWSFKNIII